MATSWAGCLAAIVMALPSTAMAAADGYEVKITSLPDRFVAGGQGGIMSVSATRLAPECSRIRALMLITLQGMEHGDLKVEVKTAQGWEISPISRANDHTLRAEDNWIDVNFLCQGQVRALQHRITFLPGAPAGSALIDVVISSHGDSAEAGRGKATRPVVAGAAAPAPSRTKTATPPAPVAGPSTVDDAPGGPAVGRAERALAQTRPVSNVVMLAGGGVIVLGLAALLVVLFMLRRRRRGERVVSDVSNVEG